MEVEPCLHLSSAALAVFAEVLSPNTRIISSMKESAKSRGGMTYVNALRFTYWSVTPCTYAFFINNAENQDWAGVESEVVEVK